MKKPAYSKELLIRNAGARHVKELVIAFLLDDVPLHGPFQDGLEEGLCYVE